MTRLKRKGRDMWRAENMKLIIRLAEPKTDKEQMFRVEARVEDIRKPGKAYVNLNGMEYLIEVHY